jgi:hypothetical protein
MLNYLDEKVGKGRYVIALSSDHGVCPLPEQSRKKGIDAVRIDANKLMKDARAFMEHAFGDPGSDSGEWLEGSNFDFYINEKLLKAKGVDRAKAESALAEWLTGQPGILGGYPKTKMLVAETNDDDPVLKLIRRSFYAPRSGDVMVVLRPYCLSSEYPTGTTHGSPHDYDRHVPLFVFGGGVPAAIRTDEVAPQLAATYLSNVLGIPKPAGDTFELPQPPDTGAAQGR